MVLLTMTLSIVEGLLKLEQPLGPRRPDETEAEAPPQPETTEPSLESPEVGKPISHGQIVDLWKRLHASGHSTCNLEQLLRGANVYIPPPPPKPEPSAQYKALMARLRRDEEARSYERMVNPHLQPESFSDRFPNSAYGFEEVHRPDAADMGDDEISYNEVHRQVTLILNFLVSIAGVAGTLWIAARWWSTTSRLFLTLGGSILVAIAEVVVYNGYMWRMGEAKKKQGGIKELKEVVETWVVGQDEAEDDETVLLKEKEEDSPETETLRKRRPEQKETT